jgi:hypothetical protein
VNPEALGAGIGGIDRLDGLSSVKAIGVSVIYVTSPSHVVAECIRARQTRLEQFASF